MTTTQDICEALDAGTLTPAEFYERMKVEGRKIDAGSAIVYCIYRDLMDPYGMFPYHAAQCVARTYFARAPGSTIAVEFGDLPDDTRNALHDRWMSGKLPETVPYDNRVERLADVISDFFDEPLDDEGFQQRAMALAAAKAALDVLQELDTTTS